MRTLTNLLVGSAGLLLTTVGTARVAEAYNVGYCNGNAVKWTSPPEFTRNTCSIPYNGTRWNAYANALNRWNGIGAMQNILQDNGAVFSWCIPDDYGLDNLDNSTNEVAVVDPSQLDGGNASGITFRHYTWCFLDQSITEADVFVGDVHNMGQPEPIITSSGGGLGKGRETFLHEFGHALGLDHYGTFNMMRSGQSTSSSGFIRFGGSGERIDAAPDDAAGGRFLYPASGSERNVFAASQKHVNGTTFPFGTVITNADGGLSQKTLNVCNSTGGVFNDLKFTGGNNGTVSVTHNEKWYLSASSSQWSATSIVVSTWYGGTWNANGHYYSLHTITVPPLPTGIYYLYHQVDSSFGDAESREDDNVSRTVYRFNVTGTAC